MLLFWIALCLAASPAAQAKLHEESFVLPVPVSTGPVTHLTTDVGSRPLDTLYITNPNSSSYEWWYFDALAHDLSASIVLQPFDVAVFGIIVGLSFPDGTAQVFTLAYNSSRLTAAGEGSNMTTPNGWSYEMAADLSTVVWDVNIPSIGLSGTVELESVAPPHVACSAIHDGANLQYYKNLLWVNPIPGALARVKLDVNGSTLAFEGIGYHDKNWGPSDFTVDLNQWYWGHGKTDEYSVVWFYHINDAGAVTGSSYISQDGRIVYSACGDSLWVRTFTDEGIVYPVPYGYNGSTKGVEVRIDAGKIGKFVFTATQKHKTVQTDVYTRWNGEFVGGLVGHKNCSGIALWEQQGPYPPAA